MAFDWRLAAGGAALVWATLLAPATSHAQPDACRQIRQACRADGFEPGKGLVKQCYNPIVQGGGGRAAGLPKVSADVVAACRAGLTTNARPAPAPLPPQGRGGSGDGGQTVYDPKLKVYWLADADLPAKQTFGVAGVNRDGSMSYPTAVAWVRAMNATDHGRGYLGHNNWMLPTNPSNDPGCSSSNRKGGGSFGYGCKKSALGSLYYKTLGLREPATAVAMPDTRTGPFHDFQPYLYWTQTLNGHGVSNGYDTFSFDTGWSGSNVSNHVLYALPMIPGNPFGAPAHRGLQPVAGGQAVYDPASDATWLADADFAKTKSFGVAGINPDGSMQEGAAATWAPPWPRRAGSASPDGPCQPAPNAAASTARRPRWARSFTTASASPPATPQSRPRTRAPGRSTTCSPTSTGPARAKPLAAPAPARRRRGWPGAFRSATASRAPTSTPTTSS